MTGTIDSRGLTARPSGVRAAPLVRFVGPDSPAAAGLGTALLEIRYGCDPGAGSDALGPLLPLQPLASGPHLERWEVDAPVRRWQEQGFHLAQCGPWAAGWALMDGAQQVEADARSLYVRLLTLSRQHGWHLQRVWNVLPALNGDSQGLERYRLFCRGRAEAFEQVWGPDFESRLCAFSAVGSESGPLVLHFLAAGAPGRPLENPRQVPAWSYPERYGPRSPSFARALRQADELGGALLVSGTASIVGHESRHPDDVEGQAREILRNLRELIGADEAAARVPLLHAVKVYLRHGEDRERVEPMLVDVVAERSDILWLRADICRAELLIEVEGTRRGAGGPRGART